MSSTTKKDLVNHDYSETLISVVFAGLSFALKKVLKDHLGAPQSIPPEVKFVLGLGASTMITSWL